MNHFLSIHDFFEEILLYLCNRQFKQIYMKLAEALSRRAQLTESIGQLKTRLKDCIKIQEGDDPAESPEDVISELDNQLGELQRLIYRINMTNSITEVEGKNITSMLAERDRLSLKTNILGDALKHLTEREDRYNRNEIKYVRCVDVKEFRRRYDHSAAALRELDLKIQSLGWTTELI